MVNVALVVPFFYLCLLATSSSSSYPGDPTDDVTYPPHPHHQQSSSKAPAPSAHQRPKTLLDAFADFFVGTTWVSNVQKYYAEYMQSEQMEQMELARNELVSIDDDISRIQTQELILRSRQSELGKWLQENAVKPLEERNPTVEELVNMESDRLALLEHRLNRLKHKLLRQKSDIASFLKMNVKATVRDTVKSSHAGRVIVDPAFEEDDLIITHTHADD